jgi:hypothetical protein
MKKIKIMFVTLIVAIGFFSCEKETKFRLDPTAPVYLNGREAVSDAKGQEALSIKEVIKTATHFFSNPPFSTIKRMGTIGGICERDTVNNRIVGYSSWVIDHTGQLITEFIETRNYIMVYVDLDNRDINTGVYPTDTLAYIPNSVMEAAETDIRAAYEAEDYEECYRLFKEAFIFYPCTGEQYRQLVEQGLN